MLETRNKLLMTKDVRHGELPIARHVALAVAFVSLFLAFNRPEIIFLSRLGSVAWYPAVGLSLALLLGVSPWYAVLVCLADALSGIWFYHQPILSFGGTFGAIGVAAIYGTAAFLLRGPLRIDLRLLRARDVVRYVFVTMTAGLVASVAGVACLVADRSISPQDFGSAGLHWFIGDGVGLLGLAPALLIHVGPWLRRKLLPDSATSKASHSHRSDQFQLKGWALFEAAGQGVSLLTALFLMFGPWWTRFELFYLAFIPILWMAMRCGIRRAATGTVALNFGIIVMAHVFPPEPALLTRIGLLMLVVSATGLVVGSTVTERERMGDELRERTTYLNTLFEKSPLGIVVLRQDGLVDLVNDAFTKMSFYEQSELEDRELDSVFVPVGASGDLELWSVANSKGQTLTQTVQRRRKDGVILDIELHAVHLVIEGHIEGAYAICKDITEQVRATVAERANSDSLNRMVKELELHAAQMTLLNEMAGLLECCASIKESCNVVGRFAPKFFPESVSGTLYTFKASRNLVEAAVSWGNVTALEPLFAPQTCWALRRGQLHWSDTENGIACSHLPCDHAAQHLCLPMVGQGETLGVLHIEFPAASAEVAVGDAQQRLGVRVASEISLSLASLQLRETLRDQSIRDPLTGLFNRRFMQESLDREIMRARRRKAPVSLLYLDIDHFKRFNDAFGHDAGDLVLKSFADYLRGFFRGDDVTCRCGGEEFVVILPESQLSNAAIRAEALRKEVKGLKLTYKDRVLDPISISIGVACFPGNGENSEELLKSADQCLYTSKADGRDRVTVVAAKQPASAN